MSRFGRVIQTAEKLVPKAKQTAAELVQEGLEGAAKTAGKTKGKTKAVLAAENEELRKQIEELKKAGGQAASASTPSTPPASVRKSLGAPKLMREAQERKTAAQFAKEGMPGRKLTMKEAESKSEVVSRAGKRYREANKGADPDTDRYFSKEGLEGATEHTGSSHPDLKVYLKRCDLMDVFERKQLIQIHMKPTPVDNTYRRPAPPPQISDDEDPDFIPFVRPQPTVVEGLAPPSVSPLVAGDTSGWTPPPDPFGGVPDPMTGAPRNFI